MRPIIQVFIPFLLIISLSSTAQAVSKLDFKQQAYLSPSLNYIFADKGRGANNGLGGQLDLGYAFSDFFSVELEAAKHIMKRGSKGSFNQLTTGINGLAHFPLEGTKISPYIIGTIGNTSTRFNIAGTKGNTKDLYIGAGVGLFYPIKEQLKLRIEARYRVDTDDQSLAAQDPFEDFIFIAGLSLPLGEWSLPKDDDHDGVKNKKDQCPKTPTGTPVDSVGCSTDKDNDGVLNTNDQCPNTYAGARVDIRGCELDDDGDGVINRTDRCPNTPLGAPVDKTGCALDTDKDSVINYSDQCPNTPEGARVDRLGCELDDDNDGVVNSQDQCPNTPVNTPVDAHGCPFPKAEEDSDHDGVMNPHDNCPNTPPNTPVDTHGCEFDTDHDGVVDRLDLCPNTLLGAPVDSHGCTKTAAVRREVRCSGTGEISPTGSADCTIILHGVTFMFNSVKVSDAEQNKTLKKVTETLLQHTKTNVMITGHTDSLGSESYNMKLSIKRANAIKTHLIASGIDATRISTQGKGESMPIADNTTDTGQALNRRIEMEILKGK